MITKWLSENASQITAGFLDNREVQLQFTTASPQFASYDKHGRAVFLGFDVGWNKRVNIALTLAGAIELRDTLFSMIGDLHADPPEDFQCGASVRATISLES